MLKIKPKQEICQIFYLGIMDNKILQNLIIYTISNLKKSERVMTRKDHKIKSYMGFVYLASLINNIKKINKNNNF